MKNLLNGVNVIIFVSGKIYCAQMLHLGSPDTPLVSLMSSINLFASSNSSCPLCLFPHVLLYWSLRVCRWFIFLSFEWQRSVFVSSHLWLCLSSYHLLWCGGPSLTDPRYTLHSLVFSPRHTPRTPADFVPDLAVVECDLVKIIPPFSWEKKDKEISRLMSGRPQTEALTLKPNSLTGENPVFMLLLCSC